MTLALDFVAFWDYWVFNI